MVYAVKEVFYTLQGEGANVGRPAVFCRFSGCNLWNGLERDRPNAICRFCDTDFVGMNGRGGGKFETASDLAQHVANFWPRNVSERKLVVCTGGEPALQLDEDLIDSLHAMSFQVAVETNGTLPLPEGIDWICISPKAGTQLALQHGNEIKVVYPQPGLHPEKFAAFPCEHLWVQPMDGPNLPANTAAAVEYCLKNPRWRLSVQAHKLIGIP